LKHPAGLHQAVPQSLPQALKVVIHPLKSATSLIYDEQPLRPGGRPTSKCQFGSHTPSCIQHEWQFTVTVHIPTALSSSSLSNITRSRRTGTITSQRTLTSFINF
jgi:hypothetical protein